MTAPLPKTCLVSRACADCAHPFLVRLIEETDGQSVSVLCDDCLEQRVWAVREARQPRKPGSGRKPGQGLGQKRGPYRRWVPARPGER